MASLHDIHLTPEPWYRRTRAWLWRVNPQDWLRRHIPTPPHKQREHYHDLARQLSALNWNFHGHAVGYNPDTATAQDEQRYQQGQRRILRSIRRLPMYVIYDEQLTIAQQAYTAELQAYRVICALRLLDVPDDLWQVATNENWVVLRRLRELRVAETTLRELTERTVRDMPTYTRKIRSPWYRGVKSQATHKAHLSLNVSRYASATRMTPVQMAAEVQRWFAEEIEDMRQDADSLRKLTGHDAKADPALHLRRLQYNIMMHVAVLRVLHIADDEIFTQIRSAAPQK